MKVKREKLVAMWGLINRLQGQKTAVKFHYLLLKNRKLLEPEITALQEAQTADPPEGHEEFNKKRLAVCNEFAEKDDNGEVKIVNNNFVIPPDQKEKFEAKLDKVKEEYKEVLEIMDKRQEDFISLLQEEVEVDLATIPLSIMPDNLVGNEVETLFEIIDGDK
jgi:hypothetical protein